jgi:hypothetical protein
VEEVLHESELTVAPDERRLEPARAPLAPPRRDHALGPPERHRLRLSLERLLAGVLVRDRSFACPPGSLADEDRPRLGHRLHARRRVDEVAGDHPLALGADGDRRIARDDTDPHRKRRRPDLPAERGHDSDQLEPCANRALGVVLVRDRRAPDGHHGIPDELLDRAAVAVDHAAGGLEVA